MTTKSIVPDGVSGVWSVERFVVESQTVEGLRFALQGRPVPPGTYTRLVRGGTSTIMSDTPAELADHREFVRRATGRVLINGLGLGLALQEALAKPEVTHVDVVELSEDVFALVAPHFEGDPRVTIHLADAFDADWPKGTTWDVAWHDIWDNICSDNLDEMAKLNRKYGRRVGWQASWCRLECLRQRRKDKAWSEW